MESLTDYWRKRLSTERARLEVEQIAAVRHIIRENIENYSRWLARAGAAD